MTDLSRQHEEEIASIYGGVRSKSSGASIVDKGDVQTDKALIECKMTGEPGKPPKRKPGIVRHMEKVADEAWEVGREPALALRYFDPTSPLASNTGWIDFTVRLSHDDAARGCGC